MLQKFGFDGMDVRGKLQRFFTGLHGQRTLIAYSAALVAIVGGGAAFALSSHPHLFSRPQVALSAAAYATASTTPTAKRITVSGEVIPLHELGIEALFDAQIRLVDVKDLQSIQKGDALLHLNDDAAQAEIETAKKALAAAQATSPIPVAASDHVSLPDAYDAGFTATSDAALLLTKVMQQQEAILFGEDVSSSHTQENLFAYFDMVKNSFPDAFTYRQAVERDYTAAQIAYKNAHTLYSAVSRTSSESDIDTFMSATYATLQSAAQLLKSSGAFLLFVEENLKNQNKDVPQQLPEGGAETSDIAHAVNDSLTRTLTAITAIKNAKSSAVPVVSADPGAADAAQRALAAAEAKIDAYIIRSPVSGKIARVHAQGGDSVHSGQELITIISEENIVRVALPASDVAAVHAGQEAVITLANAGAFKGAVMHVDKGGISIGFDKTDSQIGRAHV